MSESVEHRTQRLAWAIMIVAFFIFCLSCLGGTLGVYFFFFESTVPLVSTVRVARGTAILSDADVTERAVRQQETVSGRQISVSTDFQSQALLSFNVANVADDLTRQVVSVSLDTNTNATLMNALQPRFNWSNGRYSIVLTQVMGTLDILIPPGLERQLLVQIQARQGGIIHINGTGRYIVTATDNRLRVSNRRGDPAILFSRNFARNLVVFSGQDGVLLAERDEPTHAISNVNLLENSLFVFDTLASDTSSAPLRERWGCTNVQNAPPRGRVNADNWEGRPALRLVRGDGADSNGQTRCKHPFAEGGLDVRGYSYLELETTFLINYQSLSTCGTDGSECPMMLHVEYIDVNGVSREWFKGFYYHFNPQFDYYKSRCDSCYEDHQRLNEKVWYTYKTGNFFNIFSADSRPAFLTNVELYASGHQYDVFVSDIALLAGISDVTPTDINVQSP